MHERIILLTSGFLEICGT